jgi:hypothetical protein
MYALLIWKRRCPAKDISLCPVLWLQPEACDLRGLLLKDKVGIRKALHFYVTYITYMKYIEIYV